MRSCLQPGVPEWLQDGCKSNQLGGRLARPFATRLNQKAIEGPKSNADGPLLTSNAVIACPATERAQSGGEPIILELRVRIAASRRKRTAAVAHKRSRLLGERHPKPRARVHPVRLKLSRQQADDRLLRLQFAIIIAPGNLRAVSRR